MVSIVFKKIHKNNRIRGSPNSSSPPFTQRQFINSVIDLADKFSFLFLAQFIFNLIVPSNNETAYQSKLVTPQVWDGRSFASPRVVRSTRPCSFFVTNSTAWRRGTRFGLSANPRPFGSGRRCFIMWPFLGVLGEVLGGDLVEVLLDPGLIYGTKLCRISECGD